MKQRPHWKPSWRWRLRSAWRVLRGLPLENAFVKAAPLDRFGLMFSRSLEVGECIEVVPVSELDQLREAVNAYLLAQNSRGWTDAAGEERRRLCQVVYALNLAGTSSTCGWVSRPVLWLSSSATGTVEGSSANCMATVRWARWTS